MKGGQWATWMDVVVAGQIVTADQLVVLDSGTSVIYGFVLFLFSPGCYIIPDYPPHPFRSSDHTGTAILLHRAVCRSRANKNATSKDL